MRLSEKRVLTWEIHATRKKLYFKVQPPLLPEIFGLKLKLYILLVSCTDFLKVYVGNLTNRVEFSVRNSTNCFFAHYYYNRDFF